MEGFHHPGSNAFDDWLLFERESRRRMISKGLEDGIKARGKMSDFNEITDGLPEYETWPGSRDTVRKTSDET